MHSRLFLESERGEVAHLHGAWVARLDREWWKWRWILWDLPEDFAAFSKFDFGQAWFGDILVNIVPILKWAWIKSYSHPYHPSISPLFKGKKQKFCPSRMVPGPSKRCPSVGWATPPRAFWRKWRWKWALDRKAVGRNSLFGNFNAGKNILKHTWKDWDKIWDL